MNIRKFAIAAGVAAVGALTALSGALAYPAAATTALNVRGGPGTQYGVVGVLQSNQVVEVVECRSSGWCLVEDRNTRGWASSNYLRRVSGVPGRPSSGPDVGISIDGPNFSFSIGSGNSRPSRREAVCFYDEYDFDGRSFCVRDGSGDNFLSSRWDDRIRSIRIEGDLEATVCTSPGMRGRCVTLDRSARSLGRLSDEISSYRVRED